MQEKLCIFWTFNDYETILTDVHCGFQNSLLEHDKKVVLLIDNVDFSNEYSDKIDNIKDFLAKYPNVRLICTTQGRNTVGTTGPSDQIIPSSRSLQIASFKAEQIRELAGKWYNGGSYGDVWRGRQRGFKRLRSCR